jgi:hypothetical protein
MYLNNNNNKEWEYKYLLRKYLNYNVKLIEVVNKKKKTILK